MGYTSIKSKPCTEPGCEYPRFAKGYCKYHQSLRTDKKAPKPIPKTSNKPLRAKKSVNKVSDRRKKELVEKKVVYELFDSLNPLVCSGCGQKFKREQLDHSHLIPVSRWRMGLTVLENIRWHCNDFGNGCHGTWETHNPNITQHMNDYTGSMAYIEKQDPQYHQLLINKLEN